MCVPKRSRESVRMRIKRTVSIKAQGKPVTPIPNFSSKMQFLLVESESLAKNSVTKCFRVEW